MAIPFPRWAVGTASPLCSASPLLLLCRAFPCVTVSQDVLSAQCASFFDSTPGCRMTLLALQSRPPCSCRCCCRSGFAKLPLRCLHFLLGLRLVEHRLGSRSQLTRPQATLGLAGLPQWVGWRRSTACGASSASCSWTGCMLRRQGPLDPTTTSALLLRVDSRRSSPAIQLSHENAPTCYLLVRRLPAGGSSRCPRALDWPRHRWGGRLGSCLAARFRRHPARHWARLVPAARRAGRIPWRGCILASRRHGLPRTMPAKPREVAGRVRLALATLATHGECKHHNTRKACASADPAS